MGSLQEYANLFEKLDLSELSVEEDGLKLTLKRNSAAAVRSNPQPAPLPEAPRKETEAVSGTEIKAPLLGVFYDREVPVKEGDIVKKGDVLCSIEAMKMMNEVRSSVDGKVVKILAENGSLVEYHQTLFIIG
ncbi:MAG: biotin/lipoyl-binding protein [Lachnospiraceae bacterium]|nr:biotin/lipoyl-binding protein [Lachnospiraceae bacterium]